MPEQRRHLGFVALLFVSVGGILGSGWLFGPLYAVQLAGPAALVAWVIGGLAIMIIALNFAELGSMLPLNGGITRYALLTYGRTVGFLPHSPLGSPLLSSSLPRFRLFYNTFRSTSLGSPRKQPRWGAKQRRTR